MADPINYMAMIPQNNWGTNLVDGMQAGQAMQLNQQAQQMNQIKIEDALAARKAQEQARIAAEARAVQFQSDMEDAWKNKDDRMVFQRLAIKYPERGEQLNKLYETVGTEAKQDELKAMFQVATLARANDGPRAAAVLDERIESARNAGRSVVGLEKLREALINNPTAAAPMLDAMAASLDPVNYEKMVKGMQEAQLTPDKVREQQAKAKREEIITQNEPTRLQLEFGYKQQQIDDLRSQIDDRANRFGLDRDKFESDVQLKLEEIYSRGMQLSDDAKKLLNASATDAIAAEQSSEQLNEMAGQFAQLSPSDGLFASGLEFVKRNMGGQDAVTQLRQRYIQLRNSQAMKMLPPGVATDRDVQMALSGFPAENADAEYMASFLRGMAKMQRVQAINKNAESEWLGSVGHMGKPKQDIVVDGVQVPAGTTFPEFMRNYVKLKVEQREAQEEQKAIPQRSYMRHAKPAPAPQARNVNRVQGQ